MQSWANISCTVSFQVQFTQDILSTSAIAIPLAETNTHMHKDS